MYIGSTGPSGLHHLVYEVVDNAVDEAMAGHANRIEVTLLKDGGCRVVDNGRGIPVDEHPEYPGTSAAEIVLTTLHAGGKFGGEGYKVSGGLHGVGVSVVNALSEWLEAEVHRDGGAYQQRFERGVPKTKVKKIGSARDTGTTITFKADHQIFKEIAYSWETILQRLRQQAYLTPGVRIAVTDERKAGTVTHYT